MEQDLYTQKIALISNNVEIVGIIESQMTSKAYDLYIYSNMDSFLPELYKLGFGIVILTVQVSDYSIIKSISKIKEFDKSIRIIMVTIRPSEQFERNVRSKGISYFAIWPNDQKFLKEITKAALVSRFRERHLKHYQNSFSHKQRACL